jgi:hypothetical protein
MTTTQEENRELTRTLARLNARAWGIALGLLAGGGLLLATLFLVARGGPTVGQHLALLRAYFPGYSVTIAGSFVGLVYGFVVGYAVGRIIGSVYNRLVRTA